jgi:hypothetical protein
MNLIGGWAGLRKRGWRKSKSQTYRDIRAGKFPPPVYPGRNPDWTDEDWDAFLTKLVAERDAKEETA